MAYPRRRNHHLNRLFPVVSAISAAIFLLFVYISFLAPSPVENDHIRHTRISNPLQYKDVSHVEGNGAAQTFHIPDSGGAHDVDLWSTKNAEFFYGCSNATAKFAKAAAVIRSNRYLAIATSGGLNQQRTGITDAVVAARILNATLVVPKLDQKSFWKDVSNFSEIFDVAWFISYLEKDVKVIKELPQRRGQPWNPYTMRVPRKCNEHCYISRLLPVLTKKRAVQLTKFDYRLSNKLDLDLQRLRCRVNYHALRFTKPILEMGAELVRRMRMKSKHYIALHLRFEPDMLAFSGCYYGGGDKERKDLAKIRRRWKTLHSPNPERERRQGRCPLTPEEVGLLLRALGYDRETHIFVASGEVYGGETTLAPLKALFPNFYSKDILANKEELEPFSGFSSRMAALDFIVCDESNVFVTNNNGNMAKILAGRRRYFGHKPTIRPNSKKLYRLFDGRNNMTWEEFSTRVRTFQRGFMGAPKEIRAGRGVFHENPASCICENPDTTNVVSVKRPGKVSSPGKRDVSLLNDYSNAGDDLEWSEPEDEEDIKRQQGHNVSEPEDEEDIKSQQGHNVYNETSLEDDSLLSEEPELDYLLSD
ncbi:O-fucosyltransferase 16-like isoform X1 [Salvia splendens]|uniref:O-fucosyltransferase 16-like isoform X1 n=1 Tax=Salvia splendens TaxID=180675 RepID=UPI0011036693|nr:O-fucosyltransferase 16-like isoform X1 [Salvia splendens]